VVREAVGLFHHQQLHQHVNDNSNNSPVKDVLYAFSSIATTDLKKMHQNIYHMTIAVTIIDIKIKTSRHVTTLLSTTTEVI
jgi:hypothetical protein